MSERTKITIGGREILLGNDSRPGLVTAAPVESFFDLIRRHLSAGKFTLYVAGEPMFVGAPTEASEPK